MKNKSSLSLIAAAMALVAIRATLCAAQTDSTIEAGAQKTGIDRNFREGGDAKVQAEDGVVTVTGTVSEDSKTVLAGEAVEALPGVLRGESKVGITAGPVRPVPPTAPSRLRVVGVVTRTSAAPNDTEKTQANKGARDVQSINNEKAFK